MQQEWATYSFNYPLARVDIRKKFKLNLILTNPELFIIYWTCHHLFWFRFLKLLLIFCCQSSWREISILKKQFLCRGFPKSNCKIKIRIFWSFILIFNLRRKLYICQFHQRLYPLVAFMFTWFSFVSLIIWTCFRLQKNKQRLRLRRKGGRDKT